MNNEEPLSAKEILLHTEGAAMLNALGDNKPPSVGIVLPDGTPATPVEPPKPKVMTQAEARAKAHEIVAARKYKNVTRMLEIIGENPELQDVQQVIFACYRIIFWTRMEMSTHGDVMDDMVADFERHVEQSIYEDSKGYNFELAVKQMRHGALKIMDDFVRKYQDYGRARAQQLKRIKKLIGNDGIALPGEVFKTVLGKPFMPGQLLVVAGKPADTGPLLTRIFDEFGIKQNINAHVYSMADGFSPPVPEHFHQISEWKNAGAKVSKLHEVLEPSKQRDNVLVLIEDLESLYVVDERGFHSSERKAYALNRLFQWAIDNMMAVIVADNIAEDVYDGRFYGHIPSVKVTSRETAAGMEVLVNGAPIPPLEINEDEQ